MGVWCHLAVSPLHDVVAGDRRASGDPDPGQRTLGATLHRTQPGDTTAAHWSCPGPSLSTPPPADTSTGHEISRCLLLVEVEKAELALSQLRTCKRKYDKEVFKHG